MEATISLQRKTSKTLVVPPIQRKETFDMSKYLAVFFMSLVPVFYLAFLRDVSNDLEEHGPSWS